MSLDLVDVSVELPGLDAKKILDGVTIRYPPCCFSAVIGPSGCGKTTLIKTIAGIVNGSESGTVYWKGRDLEIRDFEPGECAYVPQFSNFHEKLTSREILLYARRIKVADRGKKASSAFVERLLAEVGLIGAADQAAETLSGGQRRRLSLAVELCSEPSILLCDEVTSGLDSRSEREILELLRRQVVDHGRMVIVVTHAQRDYYIFDSVTVLNKGRVAFHGTPHHANTFFDVTTIADVNELLAEPGSELWADRFADEFGGHVEIDTSFSHHHESCESENHAAGGGRPGAAQQFCLVLSRRLRCFLRNPGEILLHLLLIASFPAIIAIFAWNGLPKIRSLGFGIERNLSIRFEEANEFLKASTEAGSLVSGITMFQVILLCIMGANNSSREIAKERRIFEAERLGGLRAGPYVISKIVFLLLLCVPQSVWMAVFVHYGCQFPGDLLVKCGFLFLATMTLTITGLAISSLAKSSETASLVSLYVVGFQIPLSGAVLALPEAIGPFVKPFISSYWSWSGVVRTLEVENYYDIVVAVAPSSVAGAGVSFAVLCAHISAGILFTCLGCHHRRVEALQ
jgi:ABC-type multidrug transport system ATPase subunit